jgi:hypothetical protein
VAPQITYKCLSPETSPTDDQLSKAVPVCIRQVERVEELLSQQSVGDVVKVQDLRYSDEERSFRVVRVGPLTTSRFVDDPGTAVENLNVYVTDPA